MTIDLDFSVDGYVHARPALVVPALTAPDLWRVIEPGLSLRTYHDRGEEGMRWYVSGAAVGMTGTAELWVEPWRDGTVTHLFLRCILRPPTLRARLRARRIRRTAERRLRMALFAQKDRLEASAARTEPADRAALGSDLAVTLDHSDHAEPGAVVVGGSGATNPAAGRRESNDPRTTNRPRTHDGGEIGRTIGSPTGEIESGPRYRGTT